MNRNDDRLSLRIVDLYIKMSESLSLQEKALMVNHFINKGLVECKNGEQYYQVTYRIVNDALDIIIDCNNNHLIDFLNFISKDNYNNRHFYNTLPDCLDYINGHYYLWKELIFNQMNDFLNEHALSYYDACNYHIMHDKFMIVCDGPFVGDYRNFISCLTYDDIHKNAEYDCVDEHYKYDHIDSVLLSKKFIDSLDLFNDEKQSDIYFELNRVFDEIIVQTLNNNLV